MAENFRTGRKHKGKRRNCSLRAISPLPTVFSKDSYCRHVKTRASMGKGQPFTIQSGNFMKLRKIPSENIVGKEQTLVSTFLSLILSSQCFLAQRKMISFVAYLIYFPKYNFVKYMHHHLYYITVFLVGRKHFGEKEKILVTLSSLISTMFSKPSISLKHVVKC